jgi:S1-C subfamily serine protease
MTLALCAVCCLATQSISATDSYYDVISKVQPKVVKVFGAGGLRSLEHYQSGFLISADGHVLTAWSYVLDSDSVSVVLNDGRRFQGTLLGADPRLEIAILKIDASELQHFELTQSVSLRAGDRVLAFTNLFGVATGDEASSVLHGQVAAATPLAARRGAFDTPYGGLAYILDAMTNNPGSAGGALTNHRGQLAGIVGKELRSRVDNTWLNYAIPINELDAAVKDILAGKLRPRVDETARRPAEPMSLRLLGITLVPDVVARTPPYIDRITPGSAAEKAGLRADDLVLFVNGHIASSIEALNDQLAHVDRIDEIRLVIQRGQELIEVSLFANSR